ncbi:methyltransferase FkbM [Moraxella macacae 0408225]|uniref:Methyltransferase FkbM n=1 Tax=Moraxella macacae 0408225 TaxID=1230338 RepID=L2F806_9GAMM|nr:hypothetical protein [Moraxella macacae]ELA08916.1 methyltransferase FkbM [Moraxella macacae 0408225]
MLVDKLPSLPQGYQGLAESYYAKENYDQAVNFTKQLRDIDKHNNLRYWWKNPIDKTISGNVTSFNKVIGIRAHRWGQEEEDTYQLLLQAFHPDEIFVIFDEMADKPKVAAPNYVNKLSLNDDFLTRNRLLTGKQHKKLGWLCGDYFYYVMAENIQADFYWLIEPDVRFTFDNIADFFELYHDADKDGLLVNFHKPQPTDNWYWKKHVESVSLEVHKCLFPLGRLSKLGVIACIAERKRICDKFKYGELALNLYPNDESLVAAALVKHQLNVDSLNSICNCFQYCNLNPKLYPKAESLLPKNKVIHAAKYFQDTVNTFLKRIDGPMLNELDKFLIHNEDAQAFAKEVQCGIYEKVLNGIYLKSMQDYKTRIDKLLKTSSVAKLIKIWVHNQNTLVLDFKQDSIAIALDMVISADEVNTTLVFRNNNQKVMDFAKSFYNQALNDQQKIAIDSSSFADFDQNLSKIVNQFEQLCRYLDNFKLYQ